MRKIKQWYKKLNKFEKVIFWIIFAILTFFLLVALINITISLGYAGIKLKAVTWQTFSTAYSKDICFKISAIISTIVVLVVAGFIGYQKWQHFDMFDYEQKKKAKQKEQEFKQIKQSNLLKLNKNFGLIKSNLTQHTLLVGTTGSGKTTTLMQIIKELRFKFRETTIIIDGKGDVNLIEKIKQQDPNAFIWEIGGTTEYKPFANKNKVILADKIMSLFDFSEQYYQNLAHNYLLLLLDTLLKNDIAITFDNLVKYFPIKQLEKLIAFNDNSISLLSNFDEKDINGLFNQLNVYNTQLNNSLGNKNTLLELITKHKTILFSINSLMYPKLAGSVGKIIIQDLKELRFKFRETTIIIDGKGDVNLIEKIKQQDPNAFIWEIGGTTEYKPFANKNKVILADKIMSLFDFSEQYYQNLAHNYLLLLLDTLLKNDIAITFDNLVKYFPIKQLEKLIAFNDNSISLLSNFDK